MGPSDLVLNNSSPTTHLQQFFPDQGRSILEVTKKCKHQKCTKGRYSDGETVYPIIFAGDPQLGETELYEQALGHLETSGIPCRMLRTDFVGVKSDAEYLAKLHCLRLGFKRIMENTEHRGW